MNQNLTLFLERVANSYQRLAELPELDKTYSEELKDLFMNIEALIHASVDQGVLNQHKPINDLSKATVYRYLR